MQALLRNQYSGVCENLKELRRKAKTMNLWVLMSERPVIMQMAMEVGRDRCPALV